MPTTYSRAVIGSMADHLYRRAKFAEVLYTLTGLVVGISGGLALVFYISRNDSNAGPIGLALAAVCMVLGLAIGYEVGARAALRLRFQAQQALVLVEIERHTAQPAAA